MKRISDTFRLVDGSRFARQVVKGLASPQAVAVVKIAIAVITMFQAFEAWSDANRKVGFHK